MAVGLLVSYAGYPFTLSSLFPDNGLALLAAVLRSEGHDVCILDFNTVELIDRIVDNSARAVLKEIYDRTNDDPTGDHREALLGATAMLGENTRRVEDDIARELIETCRRRKVDFVGFKLWSGDGFEASVRIAEQIRAKYAHIRLFAGGPAVHYCGQAAATEAPVFDAVINGDGEEAIVELARAAENRASIGDIPNRIDRVECPLCELHRTNIASLPLPDYGKEVYPVLAKAGKLKVFSIDESRGCPVRCAFCVNWAIGGQHWRIRSASQVLAEIRSIINEHGSRAVRLSGTNSPPRLLRDVCQGIIAEDLKVEFGLYLHPTGVTSSLLDLLKKAGCFGAFFGIESGSETILRRALKKRTSMERMRNVLTTCLEKGLFVAGSFIFPAPFESAETEEETRTFIEDVFTGHPLSAVNSGFPGLIPGTTWWNERKAYGFELMTDEAGYRRIMLHYKIRHLLPPTLWEPLPYSLHGIEQPQLAVRNTEFQQWVQRQGIATNLGDYDAQIGMVFGFSPIDFKSRLTELFLTGNAVEIHDMVNRANEAFGR